MANSKYKNYSASLNKQKSFNYKKKKVVINDEIENTRTLTQKEINRKRYDLRQQRYSTSKKKVMKLDDTLANRISTNDVLKLENEKNELEQKDSNSKSVILNYEEIPKKKRIEDKKNLLKKEEKKVLQENTKKEINVKEEKKEEDSLKPELNNEMEFSKQPEEEFPKKRYKFKNNEIILENDKEGNKKRVKKYLKEAILYSFGLTFINILVIWIFDDPSLLHLFDVYYLNLAVTVVLSLIINYVVSFFVNCLVTEIWVKHKGDKNDNSGIKQA